MPPHDDLEASNRALRERVAVLEAEELIREAKDIHMFKTQKENEQLRLRIGDLETALKSACEARDSALDSARALAVRASASKPQCRTKAETRTAALMRELEKVRDERDTALIAYEQEVVRVREEHEEMKRDLETAKSTVGTLRRLALEACVETSPVTETQAAHLKCMDRVHSDMCDPDGRLAAALDALDTNPNKSRQLLLSLKSDALADLAHGQIIADQLSSLCRMETIVGSFLFSSSMLRQALEQERMKVEGEQNLKAVLAIAGRELERFRSATRPLISTELLEILERH